MPELNESILHLVPPEEKATLPIGPRNAEWYERILYTPTHQVRVVETDTGWTLEFNELEPQPPDAA